MARFLGAAAVFGALVLLTVAGCGKKTEPTAEELAEYNIARAEAAAKLLAEAQARKEAREREYQKQFMPWDHVGKEIKMKIRKDDGKLMATYNANGDDRTVEIRPAFKSEHREEYYFFDDFAYCCCSFDNGMYMWRPDMVEPEYMGSMGWECPETAYDTVPKITDGIKIRDYETIDFIDDEEFLFVNYCIYQSAPTPFNCNLDIWRKSDWGRITLRTEGNKNIVDTRNKTIAHFVCLDDTNQLANGYGKPCDSAAISTFYGKYEVDESNYYVQALPEEYPEYHHLYQICTMDYTSGAIEKVRGKWRYHQ